MKDLKNIHLYEKLLEQTGNEQVAAGKCPKTIRHRAVIWNTPCNNYANFNNWLLNCWGIDSVCEMIDIHGTDLIDTSSHESMLRGLADHFQTATMRAHTKAVKMIEKPMMKHYDSMERDNRL